MALVMFIALARDVASQSSQVASTATFVPGGQELFLVDFTAGRVGIVPSAIQLLSGTLDVVMKDGKPMLRATEPSEFLITLPNGQQLPQDFTIEADVVPKDCCPPPDLTLEGTRRINQDQSSAHLLWTGDASFGWVGVIGGAQDNHEFPIPDEIRATLPEALSHVAVSIEGNTIRMFTNGTQLYAVQSRFARGTILRVTLGGRVDDAGQVHPAYLARIRIATGAPATAIAQSKSALGTGALPPVTGIVASVGPQGNASVIWSALPGATTYFVVRWKNGDEVCCSNFSPPAGTSTLAWTDGVLPSAGTYTYRVYATTPSGIGVGETSVVYQPAAAPAPAPTGVNKTGVNSTGIPVPRTIGLSAISSSGINLARSMPLPRTIDLAATQASGVTVVAMTVAPRTIALPPQAGVGTQRTSAKIVATAPAPKTVALAEVVAQGEKTVAALPMPRSIMLGALTATGSATTPTMVAPRVINLPAAIAVGTARKP